MVRKPCILCPSWSADAAGRGAAGTRATDVQGHPFVVNSFDLRQRYRSAICCGHEMRRGQHYAEFTLAAELNGAGVLDVLIGVVGPGWCTFGGGLYVRLPPAHTHQLSWLLDVRGKLGHDNRVCSWAGQPSALKHNDVVVRPSHPTNRIVGLST